MSIIMGVILITSKTFCLQKIAQFCAQIMINVTAGPGEKHLINLIRTDAISKMEPPVHPQTLVAILVSRMHASQVPSTKNIVGRYENTLEVRNWIPHYVKYIIF